MKKVIIGVTEVPKVFEVYENLKMIGVATGAEGLAELMTKENIDPARDIIYGGGGVDFCEDYGWEEGAAGKMIDEAFEIIAAK